MVSAWVWKRLLSSRSPGNQRPFPKGYTVSLVCLNRSSIVTKHKPGHQQTRSSQPLVPNWLEYRIKAVSRTADLAGCREREILVFG